MATPRPAGRSDRDGVIAPPLSPSEFSAAVTAITSAFGDPTRREIYLFAHGSDGGVTAAQVAEQFGLHPNVARHHLDKLAAGGYLEVASERGAHGGAGRPSKHYRGVGEQVSLDVSVRTDDLVLTLLGRALALLPPDEAEQMAETVGAEYGRAMAASMTGDGAHRSFRTALARSGRRPHRPWVRRSHREAGHGLAHRQRALPVRCGGDRAPGDLCRRSRHGEGHALGPLRRHPPRARSLTPAGRRHLRDILLKLTVCRLGPNDPSTEGRVATNKGT